jgi:hypothetical protein
MAKQYERDARDATRTTMAWIGVAVALAVVLFACMIGAVNHHH